MVQGSLPTVSVANNLAIVVFEGTEGALWYSMGVVDTASSTIAWSDPIMYGNGYNPTVSLYGDGKSSYGIVSGRVVVEAHQVDPGLGNLVYSAGLLTGSTPTSITWSTVLNNYYADGYYPSVALSFDGYTPANGNGSTSNISVTETHETDIGTATVGYGFGYLVSSGGGT
jgi:hypothetical protein